jgi:hypothetical protein
MVTGTCFHKGRHLWSRLFRVSGVTAGERGLREKIEVTIGTCDVLRSGHMNNAHLVARQIQSDKTAAARTLTADSLVHPSKSGISGGQSPVRARFWENWPCQWAFSEHEFCEIMSDLNRDDCQR